MNTKARVFLARNQKVFGPLSHDEIQALRQSGQLSSYTWIFREGESQWTPIDPPPAIPSVTQRPSLHVVPEPPVYSEPPLARNPAPARSQSVDVDKDAYRVILFDQRNAVSGWLVSASDGGCEIHSDQSGTDPLFVQKAAACLTLHDTRSGESMKLTVRLSAIARARSGWIYRVRWNAAPSLLERSGQSLAA